MVIFLGPPGAGKSIQGQMLSKKHGWKWFSMGKAIRGMDDPSVKTTMLGGGLVSSETTYSAIEKSLDEEYGTGKVIIDGFPRSKEQADWLVASKYRKDVDLVLVFDISKEESLKRLELRARVDDTPEIIEERVKLYDDSINGILEVLENANIRVVHIKGEDEMERVHEKVLEVFSKCNLK